MELSYPVKTALQSLMKERWINLLSCLTVAASLLISALAITTIYNVEQFTGALPSKFTMVVYLKDNIQPDDVRKLDADLKAKSYASGTRYIPKEQALTELKRTLKDVSNVVEGLDDNPLSSAIELKLKKERVTLSSVKGISDEIRKMNGVDEVYYEAKIAETVHLLKTSIENLSIVILAIIVLVVLFVISSTVKILFYRRKTEMEIIKLLGATGGFIRAPFIIEGGLLGFIGGIMASLGAIGFYLAVTESLGMLIPLLKSLSMPVEIVILMPVAGIVMGVLGSLISVGRLRL